MGQEHSSYLSHSSNAALDLFYGYVMARGWVGWGRAIMFNYLAIIAREYFASRIMWETSTGAISSSWSTKEFGNGDGTMEIPRITRVSQDTP